ncbi:MAG: serine/threonine-protein kinase [Malacoplasma sp.]
MNTKNFIGSIFLEKYKITKLIEKGGMDSEIYLAENLEYQDDTYFSQKHKYSAIKIIRKTHNTTSDHWNRILDEGVTNARLNISDYVVKLYDFSVSHDNTTVILVLEYLDGPSLKKLIRDRGSLTPFESLSILEKIVLGIKDMHQKDRIIIHRDLKPENILLSNDLLDVKIADFGISSVVLKETENREILTNENSFFGTIPYVTPDLAKKHIINDKSFPIITKQYDFHALGVILYEMLVGDKPFEILDENDPKIIFYFKKYDITPLQKINSQIKDSIENIFLKLTASHDRDLHLRYNDADEILHDIKNAMADILTNSNEVKTLKPYLKRVYQKDLLIDFKKRFNFSKLFFKEKIFISFLFMSLIIFAIFVIVFTLAMVLKW